MSTRVNACTYVCMHVCVCVFVLLLGMMTSDGGPSANTDLPGNACLLTRLARVSILSCGSRAYVNTGKNPFTPTFAWVNTHESAGASSGCIVVNLSVNCC